MQPSQQQGLRMPSLSSLAVLLTCSFLVSSFFTKVTQHIHSLRASGLISCQAAKAFGSEARASFKSVGSLCTVPGGIFSLFIKLFYRKRSRQRASGYLFMNFLSM